MRKLLIASALLLLAGKVGAELDTDQCAFPDPPAVPDGATASEEAMTQAGLDVRAYVAEVQSSLECLAAAEQQAQGEITEDQQAELVSLYNTKVDEMNAVADEYNAQVREYLARD